MFDNVDAEHEVEAAHAVGERFERLKHKVGLVEQHVVHFATELLGIAARDFKTMIQESTKKRT